MTEKLETHAHDEGEKVWPDLSTLLSPHSR